MSTTTATPALKPIDGLDGNKEVKGLTLEKDKEYRAIIQNNCLTVYNSKLDKKNAPSLTKNTVKNNIQISIKLGKYKGHIDYKGKTTDVMGVNTGIYLAFENVNDNSEYLLISEKEIIKIEEDTGAASTAAVPVAAGPTTGLGAAVPPPAVPTTGLDAAVPPAVPTTGLDAAVPPAVPTTGLDAAVPPAASTPDLLGKRSRSDNDETESIQDADTDDSNGTKRSRFGGKRRTSRRGGASKKRVSKKTRKTRKAKRAGRKA